MDSTYFPHSGNISYTKLENGITILVYENFTAQSVVVAGTLHAGAVYDPVSQKGLASLTANLLMRGTINYDFDMIHTQLEDIGADLEIYAGTHKAGFMGKSLAEDLHIVLDVLSDAFQKPVFPKDEFHRAVGEHKTWLKYQNQDTRRRAEDAFHQMVYPESHPYHYPTRGVIRTIDQITIEDLREFHASHYSPDGMIICVVGAVKASYVVDLIRERFAAWTTQKRTQTAMDFFSVPKANKLLRHQEIIAGKSQADIVLGIAGPSRFSNLYQHANLANGILGQFGMMGRLGEVIREQLGLVYYVYSRLNGGFGPGAWYVSAGVDPADTDEVIEHILQEIEKMCVLAITPQELDDVKAYFVGRLPLQLENNEGICMTLMTLESYHLGLDYLLEYPDMIKSVTADDIYEVMSKYWGDHRLVISVAGPETLEK